MVLVWRVLVPGGETLLAVKHKVATMKRVKMKSTVTFMLISVDGSEAVLEPMLSS